MAETLSEKDPQITVKFKAKPMWYERLLKKIQDGRT